MVANGSPPLMKVATRFFILEPVNDDIVSAKVLAASASSGFKILSAKKNGNAFAVKSLKLLPRSANDLPKLRNDVIPSINFATLSSIIAAVRTLIPSRTLASINLAPIINGCAPAINRPNAVPSFGIRFITFVPNPSTILPKKDPNP